VIVVQVTDLGLDKVVARSSAAIGIVSADAEDNLDQVK
jgi:hypothetical protein